MEYNSGSNRARNFRRITPRSKDDKSEKNKLLQYILNTSCTYFISVLKDDFDAAFPPRSTDGYIVFGSPKVPLSALTVHVGEALFLFRRPWSADIFHQQIWKGDSVGSAKNHLSYTSGASLWNLSSMSQYCGFLNFHVISPNFTIFWTKFVKKETIEQNRSSSLEK